MIRFNENCGATSCKRVKDTAPLTMFHFFSLTGDLVASLLRDWVDMNSLGAFDSACCSYDLRPQYASIVCSESFVHDTMYSGYDVDNQVAHVEWLTKRGVRTRTWLFRYPIPPVLLLNLVATVGGGHVDTLYLDIIEEGETAGLFAIVFGGCKRIANVLVDQCEHWTGLCAMGADAQRSLQELVIKDCSTDYIAKFDWNYFPNLERIYLGGAYQTRVVHSLLNAAPNLVDLRLNQARLNDAGLAVLSRHAGRLRTVALQDCELITDSGLSALAERCVCLLRCRCGCAFACPGHFEPNWLLRLRQCRSRSIGPLIEAVASFCLEGKHPFSAPPCSGCGRMAYHH
jgi:hypothetical protein